MAAGAVQQPTRTSTPMALPRGEFLGLPLTPLTVDGLLDVLVPPPGVERPPRASAYLNAHTVNMALRRGSELGRLLPRFDVVHADGMAVVKGARRRGVAVPERLSSADFFWRFCWAAAARRRRVAFLGGEPRVLQACLDHVQQQVPGLQIVWSHHGFFESAQEDALVAELARLRPDVVLVGLGTPQQERLALRLRDEARVGAAWCVGALFEYYAPGMRPRAPLWMRRAGLEWAYRLAQEPRRLGGRYVLGNLEFLARSRGLL